MKIDQNKLKNVVRKGDGKIAAQCPACAADGGDAKGEHLVVFKDGKFGCVLYEKDKAHNKLILKLAGSGDRGDGGASCRLSVKPMRVEESKVLMKVGRLGRVKPGPCPSEDKPPSAGDASAEPPGVAGWRPERPDVESVPVDDAAVATDLSEDIMGETLRDFLDLPVLAA